MTERAILFLQLGGPDPRIATIAGFGFQTVDQVAQVEGEFYYRYSFSGDGTVRLIPTPGHTPGHQVLLVRLPKRGPVLLAGDLYHYPEERAKGIVPTFEFNVDQSKASRAKVEALLKQTTAELWIEHDIATHAKLPKAPAYVE